MTRTALVLALSLAGCFSKPSFGGGDAGTGSDTGGTDMGGGDAMTDAATDAPGAFQLALAKISAGGRHVCAIGNDTRLWCWGDNDRGQLGDSPDIATGNPVLASATMTGAWTDVAAGTDHTCGIRGSTVYCWGIDAYNQSNPMSGSADVPMTPITIPGTPEKVFAGMYASCAITTTGETFCWGALNLGADLGAGPDLTPFPVTQLTAAGGTVTRFSTLAIGDDHACAIASVVEPGKLYCWGDDAHNGLGHDSSFNSDRAFNAPIPTMASAAGARYLAVDAANYVTCAISTQRGLSCWGASEQGHTLGALDGALDVPIDNLTLWDSLAVENNHVCARTMAGAIKCWGRDGDGAVGKPNYDPELSNPYLVSVNGITAGITAVTAGNGFTCVLDPNANAWCWGANRQGELGNREIATKDTPSRVQLPPLGATEVIRQITVGLDFTCALVGPPVGGARPYCWGSNETRQVDPAAISIAEPIPKQALPAGTMLVEIAAGEMHTCGRNTGGALVTCWGDNSSSQLGRTGSAGTNTLGMPALLAWNGVAAGSRASCAIADGRLYCWGDVPGDGLRQTRFDYGLTPTGLRWQSLAMGSGFAVGIAFMAGELVPRMVAFGANCDAGIGMSGTTAPSAAAVLRKGTFGDVNDQYNVLVIAAAQHNGDHTCIHYTTQQSATPRVACWGMNGQRQVSETATSCGPEVAQSMGSAWRTPVPSAQSISTANAHSCALGGDNQLYCWGGNSNHELGAVQTTGNPSQINTGQWSGVVTGYAHTCVVDDTRKAVYCWGENRHGQLGDGTRFRPTPVPSGLVLP